MKHYIFKAPRHKGDKPLETHSSEISPALLEMRAMRLGPIIMVSEEQLKNEGESI